MTDDCEFCRIAAGERSAHVLAETDRTVAFLDENPAVTGHAPVVPREHTEELLTTDEAVSSAVFETVQRVANAIEETLDPEGFSVFHTSGPLVGSVEHAHVHLLPRTAEDGVSVSLTRDRLDPETAATLTDRVREVL
ncbi:histidine triad (HIT) protein [Haloterrigena turkmenica DSM 5511]|uniref:Histidine triad (HIT) protein n=1 Tax=Haloterrigena turkmenica (strain ATCC 51198 / DSM 5511 / JCM 9101 / NCIMB 13204 / VKM B-1734 / 4k) TaxID=543526 RepID=D2RZL1_HALTV|nr:HIT domain-containing protein [Haloterrigena turkmenica]ADB62050.1 histidine triad (HIT) protein [Haloterrigena turkmenica DSM 5511]